MGKTFGVLAFVFGLIALLAGWAIMIFIFLYGSYIIYAIAGLAILFGIIGIIKDDSKALSIIGMILGIIALIVYAVAWIFILPFLLPLLAGLGL